MGVGELRCRVIDVNDLAVAKAFWSELTGLPVIRSAWPGRYAYLGQADPWRHELILHLVSTPKGPEANRSHVDLWVRDIDTAIEQIESIGGTVKKGASIYPRPHSYEGEPPAIDWAVMQDPFGNEFCLVTVLTVEEVEAVEQAALDGPGEDRHWRAAAGRTPARS